MGIMLYSLWQEQQIIKPENHYPAKKVDSAFSEWRRALFLSWPLDFLCVMRYPGLK